MVPHVTVISTKKDKVPKDLLIKSSELFFDFLKTLNITCDEIPVEFTIVFVSQKESREYNKDYRNKDVPTDVLSFYTEEVKSTFATNLNDFLTVRDLGDLIVCKDVVKENAMRFGVNSEEELIRVVIHGILHLLGFDHLEVLGESSEEIFKIQEDFIIKLRNEGFIK